jgi:hypothetical protein
MIRSLPLPLPRRAWLPVVALLHLAALLCLQSPRRPLHEDAARSGEPVFILRMFARPLPAPPPPLALTRPPVPQHPTVAPRVPAPILIPPAPSIAAGPASPDVADPLSPPADPLSPPAAEPDTLRARARQAAGGADRALRKERGEKLALHEPELASKFGEAYRDTSFGTTEKVLPNGDVLSKIVTPLGTYCWLRWSNRPVAGRDPFRDTGKQFAVQCPK